MFVYRRIFYVIYFKFNSEERSFHQLRSIICCSSISVDYSINYFSKFIQPIKLLLKSYATSERQRRATDETNAETEQTEAEQKAETTQSRDETQSRDDTQSINESRRRAEAETILRLKTGRVPCNEREMRELELAGIARSFIGSAQQQLSARGDCSHAHTRKDAHLSSLTPLTGEARAQLRKERARAQHPLRCALQACGELITRHVTMGAYTSNSNILLQRITIHYFSNCLIMFEMFNSIFSN